MSMHLRVALEEERRKSEERIYRAWEAALSLLDMRDARGPQPEVVARYWPGARLHFAVNPDPNGTPHASHGVVKTWCSSRGLHLAAGQGDEPMAVTWWEPAPKWRHTFDDERRRCLGAALPFGERGQRYIELWLVDPAMWYEVPRG